MPSASLIFDRGDVIWLAFDPQAGHEQAGRRPALVISPLIYNKASHLALVCPITSRGKGYPFEVAIPETKGLQVRGYVLSDQLRSVDLKARNAEKFAVMPEEVVTKVLENLSLLIHR